MLITNYKAKIIERVRAFILAAVIGFGFSACADWLDVVPDGIPTLDMAFNSRTQSFKYLNTCYAYMPWHGNPGVDAGMMGSDEMWTYDSWGRYGYDAFNIGLGLQNAANPLIDTWGNFYQALRDCNIFLENIGKVPDLPAWERDQMIAEVKVLKAYYHFCLVQMYGPVPIIRENLPVSINLSDVKVEREPVDDCFQYIVELLDEAAAGEMLPLNVYDPQQELGRITLPIALALKAKVLVTAASPLYNGNNDQATLKNRDGTPLFNVTPEPAKWEKAMYACREAIETCHRAGIELYKFPNTGVIKFTDTIAIQMSLRNAFTERWNSEIIWANTQSIAGGGVGGVQQLSFPRLSQEYRDASVLGRMLQVPLKIATMFYTDNGVPIDEDRTRDASKIYDLRTAQLQDRLYLRPNSTTVDLHFDREPRFYAWLGFDCGIWFGAGRNNDREELWSVYFKFGETNGMPAVIGPMPILGTSSTGYLPKKYVHYTNAMTSFTSYSTTNYPWPIFRLSDLYLLYAEAINEWEGPFGANSSEMFKYIDLVRERAGLKTVIVSWTNYARSPKFNNQTGMRDIIRQERMNELAFEGHRFWDVRRWKIAPNLYSVPIEGWSMSEFETAPFYTPRLIFNQKFGIRDYFWPIRNSNITQNRNLVQNIGW